MNARTAIMGCVTVPRLMTLHDVARDCGLTLTTVRNYHHHATKRRRMGTSRPGDLPAPDDRISGVPVWEPETIVRWKASRPGRGAGGRRRKQPTS